jgi:hypothetical protein
MDRRAATVHRDLDTKLDCRERSGTQCNAAIDQAATNGAATVEAASISHANWRASGRRENQSG